MPRFQGYGPGQVVGTPLATTTSSLIRETTDFRRYGWAAPQQDTSQTTEAQQPAPFLSAKDIQYDRPGSVAGHYGINEENVFAEGKFLNKFYDEAVVQGITGGGNRAILDILSSGKYGSGSTATNPGYKDYLKTQAALLAGYLKTGNIHEDLDPKYAVNAWDYAIREVGRGQQTKGGGFFDTIGDFAKSFVGPTIGFAVGGPLGAAVGGAIQGGVEDGPLGAITGGLGGYGIGTGLGQVGLGRTIGRAAVSEVARGALDLGGEDDGETPSDGDTPDTPIQQTDPWWHRWWQDWAGRSELGTGAVDVGRSDDVPDDSVDGTGDEEEEDLGEGDDEGEEDLPLVVIPPGGDAGDGEGDEGEGDDPNDLGDEEEDLPVIIPDEPDDTSGDDPEEPEEERDLSWWIRMFQDPATREAILAAGGIAGGAALGSGGQSIPDSNVRLPGRYDFNAGLSPALGHEDGPYERPEFITRRPLTLVSVGLVILYLMRLGGEALALTLAGVSLRHTLETTDILAGVGPE